MAKQTPPPGNKQIKTLERVFSKAGAGSRTDARSWIGAGRVRVNGKVVQNPDHWVDLENDRVTLDGKPLRAATKTYILLYKPKGLPDDVPRSGGPSDGLRPGAGGRHVDFTGGTPGPGHQRPVDPDQRHRFHRAPDQSGPQGAEDVSDQGVDAGDATSRSSGCGRGWNWRRTDASGGGDAAARQREVHASWR